MKKLLTALRRLLHPPGWALLLTPTVFSALAYIFITGQTDRIPAYPVYGLSAYCMVILLVPIPGLLRSVRASVLQRVERTAFSGRYIHDPAFRGSVSLCQGMTANFLYMVFRIAVGIRYASVWFISMGVYYLVLGGLRLYLIVCHRRCHPRRSSAAIAQRHGCCSC